MKVKQYRFKSTEEGLRMAQETLDEFESRKILAWDNVKKLSQDSGWGGLFRKNAEEVEYCSKQIQQLIKQIQKIKKDLTASS